MATGDITPNRTARSAFTITLASLAANSWRQSAVVDFATNDNLDYHLSGKITTGTTPTANSTIIVYAYAAWDTSDYTGNASGSDASYSTGYETLLRPVEVITVSSTSNLTYEWGVRSLLSIFNTPTPPSKGGIIIHNNSGAALNATAANHSLKYEPILLNVA